jgi:putative SOS response-associated peptidase YedK
VCGRFTLSTPAEILARMFELDEEPVDMLQPRYNIAPTQDVAVVRQLSAGSGRRLDLLRWGLVPSWAKDPAVGSRMINARAETVAEKPSFRAAFRKRRCVLPADGFYEWAKTEGGKQPYLFRLRSGQPFALAGLWETWHGAGGDVLDTCTIITTEANDVVRAAHPRMPVMLPPDTIGEWLDPSAEQPMHLLRLLSPYDAAEMTSVRVSKHVNSPANDDEGCVSAIN